MPWGMKKRLILAASPLCSPQLSLSVTLPASLVLTTKSTSREVFEAPDAPVAAQPESPEVVEEAATTVSPATDTAAPTVDQPKRQAHQPPPSHQHQQRHQKQHQPPPSQHQPPPSHQHRKHQNQHQHQGSTSTTAPAPEPQLRERYLGSNFARLHQHPIPEFNLASSGPKAYYTVGGGITIRDCVSDSIVAHELGHYVHFRVAKSWGAMATDSWTFCLGYDASTSRCEGGWLSDAGKTSEGRVMPGVEHAAHCIGMFWVSLALPVSRRSTSCPCKCWVQRDSSIIGSLRCHTLTSSPLADVSGFPHPVFWFHNARPHHIGSGRCCSALRQVSPIVLVCSRSAAVASPFFSDVRLSHLLLPVQELPHYHDRVSLAATGSRNPVAHC